MRICLCYCKNCGARYQFQASGNYEALDIERKYQDIEYCPECKKIIVDGLEKVEKKTEIRSISCNNFTFEEVINKRKEEQENFFKRNEKLNLENKFSIGKRVFVGHYNTKLGENSTQDAFVFENKLYFYSLYEKNKELVSLSKRVRFDLVKNEVITDNYNEDINIIKGFENYIY